MVSVARPVTTVALREEVIRLEEELRIRQWQEQQLAIADGKPFKQSPSALVVGIRTLEYTNGDKYEGEVLDTLRHGRGKHTCSTGDTYDGAWQYDKRHGRGTAIFARGISYEGQWKEDMAHGVGKATYENGGVYEGDFRKDHRWGWGLQRFPDGSMYEGEWYHDLIEGKGRWSYPDGSYYEGELGNGRRVRGRFASRDDSIEYDGSWQQDVYHGAGVMVTHNSWKYTGQWREGLQYGHGLCEYVEGLRYEGGWRQGVRCGHGVLTAQGYKYDGDWADDRQHGQGRCLLESGDKYNGQWQEGRRHGTGSCLFVNGDKFHGAWESGVRCGEGACEYANGDMYQGAWQQDRRHGFGRCKFADGTRFAGRWEDDGWVQSAAAAAGSAIVPESLPLRAVAGCDCRFTIQARDDLGNKRLTGGDDFVAELRGPSTVYATISDGGDGTHPAVLNTTTAGDHLLHITVGGEAIADSPYLVSVKAAVPAPRKCTVAGPGCTHATTLDRGCFVVEVRDQYGNRCCSAEAVASLQLKAELTTGSGACDVSMAARPDTGEVVCNYTATAPGMYRLQLTATTSGKGGSRVHLAGSPFSVQVVDQQPAAEQPAGAAAAGCPSTEPQTQPAAADAEAASARPGQPAALDQSQLWHDIAAAAFAADGVMDGWDSENEAPLSSEDKYLKAHPGVPVVENLEDLWMVSKLQRERKTKDEAAKQRRLVQLQARSGFVKVQDALRDQFGEPVPAPPLSGVLTRGASTDEARLAQATAPKLVPIPTRLPAAAH